MKLILITVFLSVPFFANNVFACSDFHKKITNCTPYSCKFKHPMGKMLGNPNLTMERKIIGLKSGKCATEEQMPNNGKMSCNFPESKLSLVSEFYKTNGKANSDFFNKSMNDGTCNISGYK